MELTQCHNQRYEIPIQLAHHAALHDWVNIDILVALRSLRGFHLGNFFAFLGAGHDVKN